MIQGILYLFFAGVREGKTIVGMDFGKEIVDADL